MTDETHSHFFIDIDEDSLPAGPLADIFDQLTEALVKDALSKGLSNEEASDAAAEFIKDNINPIQELIHGVMNEPNITQAARAYVKASNESDTAANEWVENKAQAKVTEDTHKALSSLLDSYKETDVHCPDMLYRMFSHIGPAAASIASGPVLALCNMLSGPAQCYVVISMLSTLLTQPTSRKFIAEEMVGHYPKESRLFMRRINANLREKDD